MRIRSALGPTFNNVVLGNYIGTNAAGTTVLANPAYGVLVTDGTWDNTIGGSAPGAGNIIAGSALAGVVVSGPTPPAPDPGQLDLQQRESRDQPRRQQHRRRRDARSRRRRPRPERPAEFPGAAGRGYDGSNADDRGQLNSDAAPTASSSSPRARRIRAATARASATSAQRRHRRRGRDGRFHERLRPLGGIAAGEMITATATKTRRRQFRQHFRVLRRAPHRDRPDLRGCERRCQLADAVGRTGSTCGSSSTTARRGQPRCDRHAGRHHDDHNPGAAAGTYRLFAPSG